MPARLTSKRNRRTKLIRNLKPGDVIEVTHYSGKPIVARVTITNVYETTPGFITGRRRWVAHFTPTVDYTWSSIIGYSDDYTEVL